jgi:glycosyltransferase involved in cell wall biosynthesis
MGLQLDRLPKIRLYRNETNRGVFGNKLEAIARARGEWVITCDSDNFMSREYIDRVVGIHKDPKIWYCPCFAKPHFDYRGIVGTYDWGSIKRIRTHPASRCFINTGNQVVSRESFMRVFGKYRAKRFDLMMPNYLNTPEAQRVTHKWRMVWDACDSLIFNMEWLKAGNYLSIVPGLEYEHYVGIDMNEGNYNRSPGEKTALAKVLHQQLFGRS